MLVPELFAPIRLHYPMIELKVVHAGMVRLEEMLIDGRIDLAVMSELSRSRLIDFERVAPSDRPPISLNPTARITCREATRYNVLVCILTIGIIRSTEALIDRVVFSPKTGSIGCQIPINIRNHSVQNKDLRRLPTSQSDCLRDSEIFTGDGTWLRNNPLFTDAELDAI